MKMRILVPHIQFNLETDPQELQRWKKKKKPSSSSESKGEKGDVGKKRTHQQTLKFQLNKST